MAVKYALVIYLVALASKGSGSVLPHAPLLAPAPVAHATVVDSTIDPNPAYSFAYDVQDTLTGDSKGHTESRANGIVKGQYSVADPDGTRRIVDYYADPVHGFNAVVRRVPLGVAVAPVAAKAVAPVASFAPAVSVARALPAPVPAVPYPAPAFAAPSPFLTRAAVFPAPAPVFPAPAPVATGPAYFPAAPGPAYLPSAPAHLASPYLAAPPLPSGLRSFVTPYAAGPAPLAVGTGVGAPYLPAPALW